MTPGRAGGRAASKAALKKLLRYKANMSDSDRPEGGELLSRLYIERGVPERDSKRMRKRVATLVRRLKPEGMVDRIGVVAWHRRAGGLGFGRMGRLLENAAPRDVLNTITLVHEALRGLPLSAAAAGLAPPPNW